MDNVNFLSQVLDSFLGQLDAGFTSVAGINFRLMRTLVLINIVLSTLYWLFSNDAAAGFVVKKVLTVTGLVWFVSNWDALTSIIFDSFYSGGRLLGGGGLTEAQLRDPGSIAAAGVDIALLYAERVTTLTGPVSFFTNFPEIVITCCAFVLAAIAYFGIALQLFFLTLIFHVGSLLALLVMPFAVLKQSAWIAERPVAWVFASGLRLAAIIMVLTLTAGLMADLRPAGIDEITVQRSFACIVASGMLIVFAVLAPRFAGDLIAGNPTLGLADAINASRGAAGAAGGMAGVAGAGVQAAASIRAASAAASGGPAVAAAGGVASGAVESSRGGATQAVRHAGVSFASAGAQASRSAAAVGQGVKSLGSTARSRGRGAGPSF